MRIFAMVSTRHSLDCTSLALSSFFRHTKLSDSDRFYLIDNDGSVTPEILGAYPRVILHTNSSPLGFGANANSMIDLAVEERADLFFMNNDLVFTPGWLQPLEGPEQGILSPLSNREVQYAASLVIAKSETVQDVFVCTPRMTLGDYSEHEASLDYIARVHGAKSSGYWPVFFLPFFCVKLPLAAMETIGHFDETFGEGGGEDYDYCVRAAVAGFDVKFALGAFILHFGGQSSYAVPEEKERFDAREAHFKRVFESKWGRELFELMFLEKPDLLKASLGDDADRRLGARETIATLARGRNQRIKL